MPPWEEGTLVQAEWSVKPRTQWNIHEHDSGVALVGREFFMKNAETFYRGGAIAVLLPPGLRYFHDKPRSSEVTSMLNEAETVSFTYCVVDETGRPRLSPKEGLLVQLGNIAVRRRSQEALTFHTNEVQEMTLEVYKQGASEGLWRDAQKGLRSCLETSVARLIGKPDPFIRYYNESHKGESIQAVVKVEPEYVKPMLRDLDRYLILCRKTLRGQERDSTSTVIWLPVDLSDGAPALVKRIRMARANGIKAAGDGFLGVAVKGHGTYSVGVRVAPGYETAARNALLPASMLPPAETRDVIPKFNYFVKGLPPNLDKNLCARQLVQLIGWKTAPVREVTHPSATVATWLVATDAPPPRWTFHIRTGRHGAQPVTIEEEERGKAPRRGESASKLSENLPRGSRPQMRRLYADLFKDDSDQEMAEGTLDENSTDDHNEMMTAEEGGNSVPSHKKGEDKPQRNGRWSTAPSRAAGGNGGGPAATRGLAMAKGVARESSAWNWTDDDNGRNESLLEEAVQRSVKEALTKEGEEDKQKLAQLRQEVDAEREAAKAARAREGRLEAEMTELRAENVNIKSKLDAMMQAILEIKSQLSTVGTSQANPASGEGTSCTAVPVGENLRQIRLHEECRDAGKEDDVRPTPLDPLGSTTPPKTWAEQASEAEEEDMKQFMETSTAVRRVRSPVTGRRTKRRAAVGGRGRTEDQSDGEDGGPSH